MLFQSITCSRRFVFRTLLSFALLNAIACTTWFWYSGPQQQAPIAMPHNYRPPPERQSHPIDKLIKTAEFDFKQLLHKETTDLASAARKYRQRRGRHPPPGFAQWFEYAQNRSAVIVEDLFDQIYHDLNPFWGVEAKKTRRFAKQFPKAINVRKGNTTMKMDQDIEGMAKDRMDNWLDMIGTIQEWLPDVDVPISFMDESRVLAYWEDIDKYMQEDARTRKIVPPEDVTTQYTSLGKLDKDPVPADDVKWEPAANFWDVARVGCAPDMPSRNIPSTSDFVGPPPMPSGFPKDSFDGYVRNWTSAKDPCRHPDLRESHGTFIEPVSQSTTHELIPIFDGSKLPMNNDILIPPAMYWSSREFFSGGENHGGDWGSKHTKAIWRGTASGGRNKEENWTRFHRHRFVAMINGTAVQDAEHNPHGTGEGANFVLQSYTKYRLTATKWKTLGVWLSEIADSAFVDMACFPQTKDKKCPYTDHYFEMKKPMDMKRQYAYKFLPDIDGNSYSGRYRGFLRSTSLPIKATIYSEWHDSRLFPWIHFVPMDNSFVDIYGILDYFIGVTFQTAAGKTVTEGAHDDAAKKIALAGKEWSEKVLRREDMQIYMMRLLLEFARVCDDNRLNIGFVDDLVAKKSEE